MKTTRILFFILFLSNNLSAIADGYFIGDPLYKSFSRIEYFTRIKILEKKLIKNIDTCKNGKIIEHPTTYQYKCQLIENMYGDLTDSIFSLTYTDPEFNEYNDSCHITMSYWLMSSSRGIETELKTGDVAYFCFDHFHQIMAAIDTLTEMDKFLINNLVELKKIDNFRPNIENCRALGEVQSHEFCKLTLSDDIPRVLYFHNGVITKYLCCPLKKLDNIDSNIVWQFKITKKKIIISCKKKRYSLRIMKE